MLPTFPASDFGNNGMFPKNTKAIALQYFNKSLTNL